MNKYLVPKFHKGQKLTLPGKKEDSIKRIEINPNGGKVLYWYYSFSKKPDNYYREDYLEHLTSPSPPG